MRNLVVVLLGAWFSVPLTAQNQSGVFVNEVPVKWVSRDFIAIYGDRPVDRVVPEGHYVVIADHRQNEDVAQFLGFIAAGSIVGRVDNSGFDITRGLALP